MKKLEATRRRVPILCLLLVFTLICSLNGLAQDKLLTNGNVNNNVANPAAVDCWQYAADGTTCINGQYFHSDGSQYSSTWTSSFVSGLFGGWKTGATSNDGAATASPCWSCHHSTPTSGGNAIGANYMTMGHKNMLRKVVPGQTPWNLDGVGLFSDTGNADPSGNLYDWTAGTITLKSSGSTLPLYYLFGWNNDPYTLFQGGGEGTLGFNYQCARCHTTGYRFDKNGPEPTTYNGTALSDTDFSRYPASGAKGDSSSWYLTGIQCERCHKADKQYDATAYNPTVFNSTTTTGGRISHVVKLNPGSTLPPDFTLGACSGSGCRPLPNLPVNEKSTALCIECHRQEISKGAAGVTGSIHPAQLPGQTLGITGVADGAFKSGGSCSISHSPAYTYAQCIAAGGTYGPYAPSMSHGANGAQAFLNSPHARFVGTFDETTQNSPNLSITMTGTYNSHFTDWGEAAGSSTAGVADPTKNGGCAGCHDVHNTLLEVSATNVSSPLVKQCTDCHAEHAQSMAHPTGLNTPYPNGFGGATDLNGMASGTFTSGSCVICHMAGAKGAATYHYFRINEDVNYSTFPSAAQYYGSGGGNQQPNTFDETWYSPSGPITYKAVALDVDIACGQCHVGGDGVTNPYGLTPPTTGIPVFSRTYLAARAANMHNTQAPAPTFDPPYPYYGAPTTVNLTDTATGVDIYYTTNGTIPSTTNGTKCARGTACTVPVNSSETIYAIAVGDSWSYKPSPVAGGFYTIPVAPKPTISPSSGTYVYPVPATAKVTLADGAGGATIYYTNDGTTPTTSSTQYTVPFAITPGTIKAIAVAPGYAPSAVATSGLFTVKLATPTFSNVGANYPGTYTGSATVKLMNTDASATICYTTNGTTPTATTAGTCSNGTPIAADGTGTFQLATPGVITVRAIATAPNYTNSNLVSGTYTIR